MSKPEIRKWNEDKKDIVEEMVVARRVWLAEPNKPAKVYVPGEKVFLTGHSKKDAYFRNIIFYPDDFEKVKKYEAETKQKYAEGAEVTKESAAKATAAVKAK